MAVIDWGKATIEFGTSTNGTPPAASSGWTEIDTPVEGTIQLTTTLGDKVEAKEEGGEVIDVRYGKGGATLEFVLFSKKGKAQPFTATDGRIVGEYAFRITPEDATLTGVQIDKASVTVEQTFNTADGTRYKYTATALKPATGALLKPYTKA